MGLFNAYQSAFGGDARPTQDPFAPGAVSRTTDFQSNVTGADADSYGASAQRNTQGAGTNWNNSQASRGAQQDASGLMRQAAMGNAPSAAQAQMQQGMDSAARNQQGAASSARGAAGLAMSQYNAGANTANIQQQGNAQAAQLRAQEMSDARNAYAGQTNQMRSSDIQNASAQVQAAMGYGQLRSQIGSANMQSQQANMQSDLQQQQLKEADNQFQSQLQLQQQQQATQTTGGLLGSLGGAAASAFSDARVKENFGSLSSEAQHVSNPMAAGQSGAMSHGQSGAGFSLASRAQLGQPQANGGETVKAAGPQQPSGPKEPSTFQKTMGSLQSGLSGLGGDQHYGGISTVTVSDEHAKSHVAERDAEPAHMMDHLTPYSYDYKPGYGPPGRQYGIIAQDLERTPMGASVVHDTPTGKVIDAAHATGLHFAAEANLNERLRALEGRKGKK